jgi:hypothetical protein
MEFTFKDERVYDYSEAKNETMANRLAREDLTDLFLEFLQTRFGKDNAGIVDNNTIAFRFGNVNDNDGYPCDMCATVKPTIKLYQDHIGPNRQTNAFDLEEEIKTYNMGKKK